MWNSYLIKSRLELAKVKLALENKMSRLLRIKELVDMRSMMMGSLLSRSDEVNIFINTNHIIKLFQSSFNFFN